MENRIYSVTFDNIDSKKDTIKLEDYKGKLIMIVNTASLCGFTKQYSELEELWQQYKDRGLMIIAVPSNDFGQQEPNNDLEIANFCMTKFAISFPIAAKTIVTGSDSHEFFKMTRQKFGILSGPKWNFYKYFINPQGELVDWFSSFVSPSSDKISKIITKYLK